MITKEMVSAWQDEPVTKRFFAYVDVLVGDNDNKVHYHLRNGEPDQAANYNAGLDQLTEVLDIPEQMKMDLEEEINGDTEG